MALDVEPEIEATVAALEAGRVGEAENRCRDILCSCPINASALRLLGLVLFERGDDEQAIRLLKRSVKHAPDNAGHWFDLGVCTLATGAAADSIQCFKEAIGHQPNFTPAYHKLALLYYSMNRKDEAARLYEDWARVAPNDPEVLHMTAAATGKNVPERATDEFVQSHFDTYAENFDDRLRGRLAYRGPEIVVAALEECAGPAASNLDVLDAGCGTGLCGPLVRPWCQRLTGVDLSPKMVERAGTRGVYDGLVVSELCAFLESRPSSFDVVISADVLIYFGALERLMLGANRSLRPGGAFIATIEALSDDGGTPYRLEIHGRYSHHPSYMKHVLNNAGLQLLKLAPQTLRIELGRDVKGYVVVAAKPRSRIRH